jgi:hypothetical protein
VPTFIVLLPNRTVEAHCTSRKSTLTSRMHEGLPYACRRWFHFSLLRQVLLEIRSSIYRILSSRCKRTVLGFAEVRQSWQRVSCGDSRNQEQFCTLGIETLCAERPYLTLEDCRLFVEGFFLAEKWFLRNNREDRNVQQDSCSFTDDNTFVRGDQEPVRTVLEPVSEPCVQQRPVSRLVSKSS